MWKKMKCIVAGPQRPVQFAARQLQSYLCKAGAAKPAIVEPRSLPPTGALVLAINSMLRHGSSVGGLTLDAFRIRTDAASCRVYIDGVNARSVLFGVYAYLREEVGWNFCHYGQEQLLGRPGGGLRGRKELLCRATIASREAMINRTEPRFLDHLAKNFFNSVLVDADILLNPSKGQEILAIIADCGMDITVGGHVLPSFLPTGKYFDKHPDWFPLIKGQRREDSGHRCLSSPAGVAQLEQNALEQISRMKRQYPSLVRLTLWPDDSGFVCGCPRCRRRKFTELYVAVIERLQRAIMRVGLDVRLEYILYNADNSPWNKKNLNMMRAPPAAKRPGADMLLAYWGRTYNTGWTMSRVAKDAEALDLLRKAVKRARTTGNAARVFEYYLDSWMISPLYSPLWQALRSDGKLFADLRLDGYCQCMAAFGFPQDKQPVYWLKSLNIIPMAHQAWQPALPSCSIADYLASSFGRQAATAGKILRTLEKALSPMSRYNLAHPFPGLAGQLLWFFHCPVAWHSFDVADKKMLPVDRDRKADLARAIRMLQPLESVARSHGAMATLRRHVRFCVRRAQSLLRQFQAQDRLREGNIAAAAKLVKSALRIDPMAEYQKNEIARWIEKFPQYKSLG